MMLTRILFSLVLLGTFLVAANSQSARHGLQVSNIKDKSLADGCGCDFRFRGTSVRTQRLIFVSSIEENDQSAWMNIDGKDTEFKLVKSTESKHRERVGMKFSWTYAAGNLTVRIDLLVSRVCRPDDENCESTDYKATFTVKRGGEKRIISALGWCGC